MKVSELLESRREGWRELGLLCARVETERPRTMAPTAVSRFAALYRAACADLALADAYQLPPGTVHYLHDLVGRSHNQLYRSQRFAFRQWGHAMFVELPRRLCRDRCLWLAFVLFWGIFLAAMCLAASSPAFAKQMLGEDGMTTLEHNWANPIEGRSADESSMMVGFYIMHNTGIGLECFAYGTLLGVAGLFATTFNAGILGASFGYMLTLPERENFFHFVTAHGPFELTAIVFSAAGGMRLGFAMIDTHGMSRMAALRQAGEKAMPVMMAAMALFAMAGMIEAFLSPSAAPYAVKAAVAIASTALLLFYFVGLGLLRRPADAIG